MKQFSAMAICLLLLTGNMMYAQSGYHLISTYHIASPGWWDYLAVGPENQRLYVSHGTQVNILNEKTGDSVAVIPNTTGVHGIAFVPYLHKGYTSNGRLNNVSVFDLLNNQVVTQIPTGENPDAILYEPYSKKIITCNGRSNDLSLLDPVTEKLVATIPVGGKPETAVSDEKGRVFVNIEDKNEIVVVNMNTQKVEKRWSIAPGEGPTGLAIDLKTNRLFAGCEKLLLVINAANGAVVAQLPIGEGCDGVAFDPELHYIFASCGEGLLSVIREESADKFSKTENVPTKKGARTIAIDKKTHEVFLPTADFENTTQPGERRPAMIPGSFQVLVFGR
jgi:YVTN family beta-propeller protein